MSEPNNGAPGAAHAAALAALEPFLQRLLPAMLRCNRRWRRLPEPTRCDLIGDLRQELRLDCLEHLPVVLQLPQRERHQRWFRLVERWLYRHQPRAEVAALDHEPGAAGGGAAFEPTVQTLRGLLPGVATNVLDHLVHRAERHRNGRCNTTATATAIGLGLRRNGVRRLWADTAARLGYDDDFVAFWRRRLAEALLGLAADLLLDRGDLNVLPRRRRKPDPKGRLQRIRRIHAALTVRPVPFALRRSMSLVLRSAAALTPVALLDEAARLQPFEPAIPLWRFEAAVAATDHAAACRALRRARALGADPVAVVLARARLLEARGRGHAALLLLARARGRQRDDGRLASALASAAPLLSAAAIASPRSRSSAASARGDDHDGNLSSQPSVR